MPSKPKPPLELACRAQCCFHCHLPCPKKLIVMMAGAVITAGIALFSYTGG